jgi:hypothetical protein
MPYKLACAAPIGPGLWCSAILEAVCFVAALIGREGRHRAQARLLSKSMETPGFGELFVSFNIAAIPAAHPAKPAHPAQPTHPGPAALRADRPPIRAAAGCR